MSCEKGVSYIAFNLRKYKKIWKNIKSFHTFLSIVMCKSFTLFQEVL